MLGAAIPVLLPDLLRLAGKGAAAADTEIEKSRLAKKLVDGIGIPVLEEIIEELKQERPPVGQV